MRPLRLELEGFAAFRDPTTVDFEGADLFALTGPTGSGKSTVIDAMCFALYGTVPRYDDRRLVAPAISQGRTEARVRLDFAVGADTYTAVRVVRRRGTGATTKEARLERDGEVLAGNADELTAEVERLLGLAYDHFVKCVVLPQGEFARFLHDKPERRQELLVSLLDLGVYEEMARRARERGRSATEAATFQRGRLEGDLAGATPDALATATATATALAALLADLDAQLPVVAARGAEADAAELEAATAAERVALLRAIAIPDDVADLARAVVEAATAAAAAVVEADTTAVALDESERALLALPGARLVDDVLRDHQAVANHREQRAKGEAVLDERVADEAAEAAAVAEANDVLAEAEVVLAAVQAAHRAHAVVDDLVVGEPCPVCEQVVHTLPSVAAPADLASATTARREAAASIDRATKRLHAAQQERAKVEARMASIDAQLAELVERLEEQPEPLRAVDTAEKVRGEVAAAEAALEQARAAERAARAARTAAEREVERLRAIERDGWAAFDRVRDTVAALGPPERGGADLAGDWESLANWSSERAAADTLAAAEAQARAVRLRQETDGLLVVLAARCAEAGVEPKDGDLRDAVVRAEADARAETRRIESALDERRAVEQTAAERDRAAQLSSTMARLLGASGFEKWVLDEALGLLVEGATHLLHQLSNGQYSMTLDAKTGNFCVVDHRNADEVRSARTLSGGETFLASLALALALADQLAMLAAKGAARLESIFLDEGFGTLDPETLDTVAASIEELGASGRVVGLVSHVAELAERVPVRFEVRRGPSGSSVTRVDR